MTAPTPDTATTTTAAATSATATRANATPSTLGSPPRSRKANVALWTLQIVTALLFVNGGVLKLGGLAGSPEAFAELGLGLPGMYLVGMAELAGGIGLLVPRLAGLAALCFVPMMAGAIVLELAVHGPVMAVPPLGALIFVAILARFRRDSALRLLRAVRRP
ncbi:DoxX family protein [Streptomyces sp. RKND-216]|uniref:DoxX family protein n=1 Tax=Streptomyces sp. RKND-216 TaxID=2562581 RepID=UPI00109DBBDB|nr:DoxX family protein [Streptomyces sp. RKND-216]THA26743.1 DoxX family protein [Streptomyces sp. RKND-216]